MRIEEGWGKYCGGFGGKEEAGSERSGISSCRSCLFFCFVFCFLKVLGINSFLVVHSYEIIHDCVYEAALAGPGFLG